MNHSFPSKTAALIVTYNRLEKLQICLQATCCLDFDFIVVINNDSSDGTKEWLTTLQDSRLRIIHLDTNTGGAGGFKYGANYITTSLNVDWIFCFDDDAYPHPDLLANFFKTNKKDYQAFCSKVITKKGKICSMNIPYKKFPHDIVTTFHYKLFPQKYLPESDQTCEVESFSFVGAILHKNIFTKYRHAIYEGLFVYFDDLVFSHYLITHGCKILYIPDLVFIHDTNLDTKNYSGKKIYYLVRNLIITYKIFPQNKLFTLPVIISRIISIFLLHLSRKHIFHNLNCFFKGIRDGLLHKPISQICNP